ncbi:MAG: hypothetical protein ACKO2K_21445 [Alphaproteobacteria bacterium]
MNRKKMIGGLAIAGGIVLGASMQAMAANPLLPDYFTPNSSGILALDPLGATNGTLYAVVGQAVGPFGASSTAKVQLDDDFVGRADRSTLNQPATELVMPFDATSGKASYLLVSNPYASSREAAAVSTHWVFWGENCQELADLSICLTLNDTVVVDPTNVQAIDANNDPVGPAVNLAGKRGLVTVTAYQTDSRCSDYATTGGVLASQALVGTFTVADTSAGYSFGNDALGLFHEGGKVVLPPAGEVDRYVLQVLNPSSVQASLVVMAWLQIKGDVAEPVSAGAAFYATFYDTVESATSLPNVGVGCTTFRSISGGYGSASRAFLDSSDSLLD